MSPIAMQSQRIAESIHRLQTDRLVVIDGIRQSSSGHQRDMLNVSRSRISEQIRREAALLCFLTPVADNDSLDQRARRIARICQPYRRLRAR